MFAHCCAPFVDDYHYFRRTAVDEYAQQAVLLVQVEAAEVDWEIQKCQVALAVVVYVL